MNSASYDFRNMSARRGGGTFCAHGNADYLLENLSREDHGNVVNWKFEHLDDVFFSVLSLRIRVFLYKIGSLETLNQVFV